MTGRERALCNLLDVEQPVPPEEYPGSVILPEYIHARALDAVNGTGVDGRERSIRFKYDGTKWQGGVAMKGTALKLKKEGGYEAHINTLHVNFASLIPSHLHLHTHPSGSEELYSTILEQNTVLDGDIGVLEAEEKQHLSYYVRNIYRGLAAVPSTGDVESYLKAPWGTVGQMVVSAGGLFAMIHRDLSAKRTLQANNLNRTFKQKQDHARKVAAVLDLRDIDEIYDTDLSIDSATIKANLLRSRAEALNEDYVCYVGDDIENPELTRIDVKS